MKCTVYDANFLRDYKYVVVFARYQSKWLFCKHKSRDTWETAGGHIEPGESPLDAARREFYEETGSIEFEIDPLCDYWACDEPHETECVTWANGAVFLAQVSQMGPLPESEMEKIGLFDDIPENLTYPDITRKLIPLALERVAAKEDTSDAKTILETERLVLRMFRAADAADLAGVLGDPEVMRYVEPVYNLDKTKTFVEKYGLSMSPRVFALVEKVSQEFVGHVIFHEFGDKEIYELGWIIGRPYWRRGYAYEISKALLYHGFSEMNLHKIVAETVDAEKTLCLLKKIGMTLEGVQRRQAKLPCGERVDLYSCGILREDWLRCRRDCNS